VGECSGRRIGAGRHHALFAKGAVWIDETLEMAGQMVAFKVFPKMGQLCR